MAASFPRFNHQGSVSMKFIGHDIFIHYWLIQVFSHHGQFSLSLLNSKKQLRISIICTNYHSASSQNWPVKLFLLGPMLPRDYKSVCFMSVLLLCFVFVLNARVKILPPFSTITLCWGNQDLMQLLFLLKQDGLYTTCFCAAQIHGAKCFLFSRL